MATYEKKALLTAKGSNGDNILVYPITTIDCIDGIEDIEAHLTNKKNPHNVTPEQIGAASEDHEHLFHSGVTTAGTGAAYTASVDGITALEAGISFIMIPHTNSTSTTATLNVNSLGAKYIRQRLTTNNSATTALQSSNWLLSGKPVTVTYNGTYWVAEIARPDANSIYGTVPITAGGTGATTAEAALTNIGAAPAYTYGTDDLEAGVSALETGKLYFVYELAQEEEEEDDGGASSGSGGIL